jgi:hypothetical protein
LYLTNFAIWTSLGLGRYLLWFLDLYQPYFGVLLIFFWSVFDGFLFLFQTSYVFMNNILYQHSDRYLVQKAEAHLDAKEISHVLTILHYKEPTELLQGLVKGLAEQEAEGKKYLFLAMERSTPDQQEKINWILSNYGDSFDDIRYTIHDLRPGEIPGTGSNHFEAQVAAQKYFANKGLSTENVMFTKFDCNMRISGPLLQEMETVWCRLTESQRLSVSFMPNVFWSADIPDDERSFIEKFISFSMSVSSNMAPFSMSFVSGSLDGVCKVGYTPPGMLSEDELTFSKKMLLLPGATTYRLSSCIMKVFYPATAPSWDFGGTVFMPKLERWFIGWIEVHAYLSQWLFGRCALPDHPPVRYPAKGYGVLFLTLTRLYCAFCLPLQTVPMLFVARAVWNLWESDPEEYWWLGGLLFTNLVTLALNMSLNFLSIARIQWRLYHRFDCLKWSHSTALIQILGMPLLCWFPLKILWAFLKQGLRNRPIVHTANTDGLKNVVTKPLKGAKVRPLTAEQKEALVPLLG